MRSSFSSRPAFSRSFTIARSRLIPLRRSYERELNTEPDQDETDIGGDSATLSTYQIVSTSALEALGCLPHPDLISESASLASVDFLTIEGVKLCLPMATLSSLSAPQIHFLQVASKRHSKVLSGGSRAGFLLGDGAGVGKGRQVAALILENFLRGRTRALWISATSDLAIDAERDLRDVHALDYEACRLHDFKRVMGKRKGGDTEDLEAVFGTTGVLFLTYSTLIKRLPQVLAWFMGGGATSGPSSAPVSSASSATESTPGEGVIVFDECHKGAGPKAAEAVLALQNACPLARVLYVSATGASDPEALLHAPRLGLWGPGTHVVNNTEFSRIISKGGLGAQELVAMHLKRSGAMACRSLSYNGIVFERKMVYLDDGFEEMYDGAVAVWKEVWTEVQDAVQCGAVEKKAVTMAYWASHQRFFKQLILSAKVEYVAYRAKLEVKAGNCVVIGMQSTGEKHTEDHVEKSKASGDAVDEFAEPAKDILMRWVLNNLPCDDLQRQIKRDALVAKAEALTLPPNPLDRLIELLGGEEVVAEMTGRRKRLVRQEGGELKLTSRASSTASLENINVEEASKFQGGEKLIAIISDAASMGISLQADKSKLNQKLRVHITLELPWRADQVVQQLGRTHRSNQAQPPRYVLPCSEIAGEYRFAAAAAGRLQQLGAMTQGDRRSASASDSLAGFDIDTPSGYQALVMLFKEMTRPDWKEIRQALDGVIGEKEMRKPNVTMFLNRLLGCRVAQQKQIFRFYEAFLATCIAEAKRQNNHDVGVYQIKGSKIELLHAQPVYIDEPSGLSAKLLEFNVDRSIDFEAAYSIYLKEKEDPDSQCCFCSYTYTISRGKFTPPTTATNVALALERGERGQKVGQAGSSFTSTYMLLVRPNSGYSAANTPWGLWSSKWVPAEEDELIGPDGVSWKGSSFAEKWARGMSQNIRARQKGVSIINGDILPLLPLVSKLRYSTAQSFNIVKIETTSAHSKSYIGLLVPEDSSLKRAAQGGHFMSRFSYTSRHNGRNLYGSLMDHPLFQPSSLPQPSKASFGDELTLVERLESEGQWEPPPYPLDLDKKKEEEEEGGSGGISTPASDLEVKVKVKVKRSKRVKSEVKEKDVLEDEAGGSVVVDTSVTEKKRQRRKGVNVVPGFQGCKR